jgi:DNA (cytosine-5)-methyltransferase 1
MQPMAFAQNQRDEVRDLHDVAGALGSQPGMKQQTFVAAGVVTKGNGDCFLTKDVHTSLSGGGGQAGQGYPCVLCLNDQGGQFMDCSENVAGTLRAQMHSHQPLVLESNQEHAAVRNDGVSPTLPASMGMGGGYVPMVYENHGIDSRYTGPHSVVPTISARCGTGGNNVPLVGAEPEVYCIVGNVIDREPENGGNGCGYQQNISYTLTAMDRHAVFSRQRTDVFTKNNVVSTESARQHKDATDLIMQPYQETVGTLVCSDHKGISNQYVNDDKCIVGGINLIRRLTPLECERLQGFPDGWTNIPSASDSARYKALGNSVAIPCVEFVMRGVSMALNIENEKRRRRQVLRLKECLQIAA